MYKNIKLHLINILIMTFLFTGCNKETASSRVSSEPRFFSPYIFISQFGSKGNENGELNTLVDIDVTSKNEVCVIDYKIISSKVESYHIQKFDSNGKFIKEWGNKCNTNGRRDLPEHIAIDSKDNIYLTNSGNGCIEKFNSSGNFIKKFGGFEQILKNNIPIGIPDGVGIDFNGYIYTTNEFMPIRNAGRPWIDKYDSNGNFITKWEMNVSLLGDIIIDKSGYIYVVATFFELCGCCGKESFIYKLNSSGEIITTFFIEQGEEGEWDSHYNESSLDITTDLHGNILIANTKSNRIELFDPNGTFIIPIGTEGDKTGQFKNPRGITIDSKGNLYVADSGNYRIQKFKPNPKFKSK